MRLKALAPRVAAQAGRLAGFGANRRAAPLSERPNVRATPTMSRPRHLDGLQRIQSTMKLGTAFLLTSPFRLE
jgi:hypothetical protein